MLPDSLPPPIDTSLVFPIDLYPGLMLLCAILSLFLCTRIWYGTRKDLSQGVAFYLAAVFLLSIFKFAEFVIVSPGGKFNAVAMQWLGIAFLPCSFFIISMALKGRPLRGAGLIAVLVPGSIALALAWTNRLHSLFWIDVGGRLLPSQQILAPGYWAFSAYAFTQISVAFVLMISAARGARGLARRWILRLIFILFIPAASSAVFVLVGGRGRVDDPTPFVFALSGLLMAWTLKHFDLFEEVPYAKTVLLESIESPIVVVDSERLIIGANEDARRVFPVAGTLEGMSVGELVPALEKRMEPGEQRTWTYGGIVYLISCYDTKGTSRHWRGRIFLFRDITDIAKAKKEVEEAKAKAEAANAAKSAFIATVSHEIRNPLNSIIGLVSLDLQASLPRQLREDLEVVQSSGNVILGLVNDLLDFSKIEAGKMELEDADFDLHEKVVSVVRAFRPAAETKGISLDVEIEDGAPRYVVGDSLRYGQILMNLVSNAIKFTKTGAVTVTLSPATDPPAPGDGRDLGIRTVVRDTGIGISEENLPNLFKEFSQADSSISRRFGGTGLGLSICKRLTALFGGMIEVSSTLGEGSAFAFTARFRPAEALGPSLSPSAPQAPAGAPALRVLVVDDDPVNVAVARRYLEHLGCSTLAAQKGADAVELVASEKPDLVLLDLGLPDMDGFEACRRMREGSSGRAGEAVIVALTARVDSGIRAECASAGMYDCLPKPVDPAGLEKLLGRLSARIDELGPRAASTVRPLEVATAAEAACPDEAPPEAPLIDMGALLERVDGDSAFARELLGILVDEAPEKRNALEQAEGSRDIEGMRKIAHRLKGAALTLCAMPLVTSAGRLEIACTEASRAGSELDPGICGPLVSLAGSLDDIYSRTVEAAVKELGAV